MLSSRTLCRSNSRSFAKVCHIDIVVDDDDDDDDDAFLIRNQAWVTDFYYWYHSCMHTYIHGDIYPYNFTQQLTFR